MTRKSKRLARQQHLEQHEVARAIYFDFEGRQNESPALAGVWCEGSYTAYLLDDSLAALVESGKAPTQVMVLDAFLAHLNRWALSEDRRLVHFSQAEAEQARQAGQPLGQRAFDAKRPVKRAFPHVFAKARSVRSKRGRYAKGGSSVLAQCGRVAGFPPPHGYGSGKVGRWIATLREQVQRRGSYAALTPVAKRKWNQLLAHNRYDCVASDE